MKLHSAACVQNAIGGPLRILEFHAQHAELVAWLERGEISIVGQQLRVQRREVSDNVILAYEPAGHVDATHIFCHKYVAAIGVRDYALALQRLGLAPQELKLVS